MPVGELNGVDVNSEVFATISIHNENGRVNVLITYKNSNMIPIILK